MGEMKHTPGPWEWEILDESMMALGAVGSAAMEGNVLFVTRCEACQKEVLDLEHDKHLCNWPKRADAPLLAAAPDLLEACEMSLHAFEDNWAINWDDLRRAIAKARGEVT